MYKINIPSFVKKALDILNLKGEAFIVGGCVRDSLLGITPKDYDITTNLEPESIKEAFKDYKQINNNGLKHGTVSVVVDGEILEITTYRIDGDYLDGRHPLNVCFTKSLKEDLARRDFTINAMAYNDSVGLVDYFDGVNDLNNKIIRTVGDPYKRFSEDYLRILRALRFRGRYNFVIEANTKEAIKALASNLNLISRERINQELHEILLSDSIFTTLTEYREVIKAIIPKMGVNFDFNQYSRWHGYDVYTHIAYVTSYTKPVFDLRLAALLHDIGKGYCYTEEVCDGNIVRHFRGHAIESTNIAKEVLDDLKVSNVEKSNILYLIYYHDYPLNSTKNIKKLILNTPGQNLDLIMLLLDLKEADALNHLIQYEDFTKLRETVINLYNSLDVLSVKDLKINGNDLMNMGFKGEDIGRILKDVFIKVYFNEIKNDKNQIIKYIKKQES